MLWLMLQIFFDNFSLYALLSTKHKLVTSTAQQAREQNTYDIVREREGRER